MCKHYVILGDGGGRKVTKRWHWIKRGMGRSKWCKKELNVLFNFSSSANKARQLRTWFWDNLNGRFLERSVKGNLYEVPSYYSCCHLFFFNKQKYLLLAQFCRTIFNGYFWFPGSISPDYICPIIKLKKCSFFHIPKSLSLSLKIWD